MNESSFESRVLEKRYLKRLNQLGAEYYEALKKLAEEEFKYQEAKTITIISMEDSGESATAINNKIRGHKEVKQYRLNRDLAKAKVTAKSEQINILKMQIRALGID